jgi:hypothetical protein
MMQQLNLFLALIWLVIGCSILFFAEVAAPGLQPYRLQLALFAGVMFFYNLTRWWFVRLQRRYREEEDDAFRMGRRHPSDEIDPTFNLSDDDTHLPPKT